MGHCVIEKVYVKYDVSASDFCRLCADVDELESIEHSLCYCLKFQKRGMRWLG